VKAAAAIALVTCALGGCGGSKPLSLDGGRGGSGAVGGGAAGASAGGAGGTAGGEAAGAGGGAAGTAGEPDAGPDGDGAAGRDDGDGGGFDLTAPDEWKAFDVTATITLMPLHGTETAWSSFPKTATFTLAWAPGSLVVVGAGAVSPVALVPAVELRAINPLTASIPFATACDGTASLRLEMLGFGVDGAGKLSGHATGSVSYLISDYGYSAQATFALSGVADATPPALTQASGTVDPLARLHLAASEALSVAGAPALVGMTSGDRIPLAAAAVGDGAPGLASGFDLPDVMLRWGEAYTVDAAGVTDLAGHALAAPPTETTPAAPPLAPEDGFEAVTGTTYGGAGVLVGGPLAPIAGTKSLILMAGPGLPSSLPYPRTPSVALRLAVAPGDTVVRFDRRLVAAYMTGAGFQGEVRVGSVGHPVTRQQSLFAMNLERVSLGASGEVWQSAVDTVELPLPAGTTGEVTFEIVGQTSRCGLPPPPTALVIDNLRVE
jgi:hypothetical protein